MSRAEQVKDLINAFKKRLEELKDDKVHNQLNKRNDNTKTDTRTTKGNTTKGSGNANV